MATRKKDSTFSRNETCIIKCDLTYAVHLIGGRWKLLILSKLEDGPRRFGDLKKEFSYMSDRMLSLQLNTMEKDGLIKRTVYPEKPPRVEYELMEGALALKPILDQLSDWGARQKAERSL